MLTSMLILADFERDPKPWPSEAATATHQSNECRAPALGSCGSGPQLALSRSVCGSTWTPPTTLHPCVTLDWHELMRLLCLLLLSRYVELVVNRLKQQACEKRVPPKPWLAGRGPLEARFFLRGDDEGGTGSHGRR